MRRSFWYRILVVGSLAKIILALPGSVVGVSARAAPFPLWLNVANLIAFTSAALLLVAGSRSDRRAESLGAYYLTFATIFGDRLLDRLAGLGWPPLTAAAELLIATRVDAFGAACLWLFARDFPAVAPSFAARLFPSIGISVAVAGGAAIAAINLVAAVLSNLERPIPPALLPLLPGSTPTIFWIAQFVLFAPSLPLIIWKGRFAPRTERRRVRLFVAAALGGLFPLVVAGAIEQLVAGATEWIARHPWIAGMLVYPALLSVPFTTAYAVLVNRALDVELVVRKALQYALVRSATYGLLAIPFLATFIYVYANRSAPVRDLLAGSSAFVLAGVLAGAITAIRYGPRLFDAIDRRFFREHYDARRTLGDLIESSRDAATESDLAQLLAQQIDRALHVDGVSLFVADDRATRLVAAGNQGSQLPLGSAIAVLIAGSVDPLDVDLHDSALRRLPEHDRRWAADRRARLIVPIFAIDRTLEGMLVLGEKRSELPFSTEDRQLLRQVASSAALALENVRIRASLGATVARSPDAAVSSRELGRWRQMSEIYHAARARPEGDRAAFVREACGSDRTLRQDIEDLLANSTASEVLDAWAAAARISAREAAIPLTGRQVGPYRILELLGKGGMGAVYRAHDTSLGRDVAIKVLSPIDALDQDRLRRFEREARLLAALNHPHIAAIYGLLDADGVRGLVLELVEGQTLGQYLAVGRPPVGDALAIALQIAAALEAAHAKGIVHRDLKPDNVKITPAATVKVLDFGLAKLPSGDLNRAVLTQAPTITTTGTHEGILVGTVPYMSPEQTRGGPLDARSDVWAFGCVLYETLCGQRAFAAKTAPDTIARILEREPNWDVLPDATPHRIRELLRRCLEKDMDRRLDDIGAARRLIEAQMVAERH